MVVPFEIWCIRMTVDFTYIGKPSEERKARLKAAEINKLTMALQGPARVQVVDGSGCAPDELDQLVEQAAQGDDEAKLLVLFDLPKGVGFHARREQLLALGATMVMPTLSVADDFLTRLRSLLQLSRPIRVLVIEDEDQIGDWAVETLKSAGMDAFRVATLKAATQCFETERIDALVIDRELPDGDGLDFAGTLYRLGIRTPALFFSAHKAASDKIRGYTETGVKDYISKPVEADEMIARVEAMLRPVTQDQSLIFGPLEIIRKDRLTRWRGDVVELRRRDQDILFYLAERANIRIPQRMLYQDVWGLNFMHEDSNRVTQARYRLVSTLTKHLEAVGDSYSGFIATEDGSYVFRPSSLLVLPK